MGKNKHISRNKDKKDYRHYQVADLLMDEDFQNWVLHPKEHPASRSLWEALLAEPSSELSKHIATARDLIQAIRFKEAFPTDASIKSALSKNLKQISAAEAPASEAASNENGRKVINESSKASRPRPERLLPISKAWRKGIAAAVMIGVLLSAYLTIKYLQSSATVSIKTAYGQTRTITLPDSSVVVLNAHSSITYPKYWRQGKTRELTLTGEAYFKVKHLNRDKTNIRPGERFIVHSGKLEVEVLGTRFDIKQAKDLSTVILEQGSVRLTLHPTGQVVKMQPGERIQYDAYSKKLTRSKVQPADYISWINHELILKGQNLQQISALLSTYYGVRITLQGAGLQQMNMEGTLMLDSLPDVLFALSTAMNLTIEQQGDTIIISKKQ